ncbi:MAG TPA: hypothetical protein VN421_09740 [Pseudoflavonifractor sp.]|jgi:hypothetical protein|nr:hypothetical protein [Pseudoflavonifractor sp.]
MRWPKKKTIWTAVACAAGAALLFVPGSIPILVVGAALGYWGRSKVEQYLHDG